MTANVSRASLAAVVCVVVALFVLGPMISGIEGPQKPPVTADLGSVVTVLRNPEATSLEKEALVGKVFSGNVTVEAVRPSGRLAQRIYSGVAVFPGTDIGEAAVLIDVDLGPQVSGNRTLASLKMQFSVPADVNNQANLDQALPFLQMPKGQGVWLRGMLKDFSVTQPSDPASLPTNWANFRDTVVERYGR